MNKTDGSGYYAWMENNKHYAVKFPVFLQYHVKHDEAATVKAIRESGAEILDATKSSTGVMLFK